MNVTTSTDRLMHLSLTSSISRGNNDPFNTVTFLQIHTPPCLVHFGGVSAVFHVWLLLPIYSILSHVFWRRPRHLSCWFLQCNVCASGWNLRNQLFVCWALNITGKLSQCYTCQGPVSVSDKTSYCSIPWSLEAARFVFRIVRSLWNLPGTSVALLPMYLSNFKATQLFKLPISQLRDMRCYDKTSCRILAQSPGSWVARLPAFMHDNQWEKFVLLDFNKPISSFSSKSVQTDHRYTNLLVSSTLPVHVHELIWLWSNTCMATTQ